MRQYALSFLIVSILSVAGCRPAAAPVSVSDRPISINDQPTTNLPMPPNKPLGEMSWTLEGDRVQKLSDIRGKAVILDFWATYCGPCKEEIPHLNSLLAKYGPDNLRIVGLNVGGPEDRAKIPGFVESTRINYEIAFPEDELTRFIFGRETGIPQTAVFDRQGRLVTKIAGFNPQVQKELDAAVAEAVRSAPPG